MAGAMAGAISRCHALAIASQYQGSKCPVSRALFLPFSNWFRIIIICLLLTEGVAMRDALTTLIELVGFGCIAAAGFTVSVTVGLAVAGLACLLIGYFAGRR